MEGVPAAEIARFRALVIGTLPQFAGGNFVTLTGGWDSVALECDGWIFKFARHPNAEARPFGPSLGDSFGGLSEFERRPGRALRVIRLVDGGVEDDHHRVSGETLDHPVLGRHDRDDLGPVRIQHRDHLGR